MKENLNGSRVSLLRKEIPKWYEKNGRSFPWRQTKDPFKILIAEIFLQKTTAEQVSSVYETFFDKFPDLKTIANAETEVIKETIKELGLLKRAEYVQELSRMILKDHSGVVPNDKNQLDALPGVGRYTRNAVLCFAFGKNVPIVDGTVSRVFSRYFGLSRSEPPYRDHELWKMASHVLPDKRAREFNLGLLDLGAEVCSASERFCDQCPLLRECLSRE